MDLSRPFQRANSTSQLGVKMTRFFLVSSGALLMGSLGAFFLFVPLLSIATVAWIFVGLLFMFGLGFQVGTQAMLRCASLAKPTHPSALTPPEPSSSWRF